ncbi:hypothetical protein RP20_CCG010323 [Aedes albopictus]|nr:hypothetical protein RP20_CCG010323 [Aedes albopictus]
MWFLKNVQNGSIYYVRPSLSKHTVSRSTGELIVQGDPSISRNHAFLYPEPTTLKVIDAGSRYGTYVNDNIETEREPIAKNSPTELRVGDRVRFGKCLSIWTVEREEFDCITSTISSVEGRLRQALEALGGKVRDAFVEGSTRYLIMRSITTTPKLLMCLIGQVPVVKPEYFEECVKAMERRGPLPKVEDFIPEFAEAYVRSEGINFGRIPGRKTLFKGKTFVFIKPKHMSQYEGIIKLAGGICICAQKRKIAKAFFTNANVIVMQAGTDSQLSQASSQAVDGLTQIVSNAGRRLIPDAEIGLAILHCSTEKYCNPMYKFANVLDLETIPFAEGGEALAKNSEECGEGGALKGAVKESISIPETESRDSSQNVDVHKSSITESTNYSEQPLKISEKTEDFVKPTNVGREKRKREATTMQGHSPKEVKKARSELVEPNIEAEQEEIPSQLEIPETPASIPSSQALSSFSGFLSVNREAAVDEEPSAQRQKQKRPLNLMLDDGEGDLFNFEEAVPKRAKRQATIAEAFTSSQQSSSTAVGRRSRQHPAEDEDLFSFDSGNSKRSKQKKSNDRSVPSSETSEPKKGTKDSPRSAPSYKQFIKPIQIPMEGWLASTFCDLKIKSQKADDDEEDVVSDTYKQDTPKQKKIKQEPGSDEDHKTRVWEDGMEGMFQVRVKCMNLTSHRPFAAGDSESTSFYSAGNGNSTVNGKHNFKAFVKKQNYKPQQTVVRTKPVCVLDNTQDDHF